jgi:hypothetical protein
MEKDLNALANGRASCAMMFTGGTLADFLEDVLSETKRVTEPAEKKHSVSKAPSKPGGFPKGWRFFLRVMIAFPRQAPMDGPDACFDSVSHFHLTELRTQLTQAMENSTLPNPELLGYFAQKATSSKMAIP